MRVKHNQVSVLIQYRKQGGTAVIYPSLWWGAVFFCKKSYENKERLNYGYEGKTSDWKKAIVTIDTNPEDKTYLAKGGKATKMSKKYKDSIDEFMGA